MEFKNIISPQVDLKFVVISLSLVRARLLNDLIVSSLFDSFFVGPDEFQKTLGIFQLCRSV